MALNNINTILTNFVCMFFCVGSVCAYVAISLYQFLYVCPPLQLSRQHFVCVVRIERGMTFWAHSTQQLYCS